MSVELHVLFGAGQVGHDEGARAASEAAQQVEQIGRSGSLTEAATAIRQLDEELALLQTAVARHRGDT